MSPRKAAGRIVAAEPRWRHDRFTSEATWTGYHLGLELLGRGRLVRHVDDLHTAVHVRRRVAGILELRLAVSNGDKVGPGNAKLVSQVALDRVRTALGQVLIVSVA